MKQVIAYITYIPRLKKSDWYFQKKQTGSKSILKSRQLSNRKIAIKKYN